MGEQREGPHIIRDDVQHRDAESQVSDGRSLDPADWTAFRVQAHAMLDDMLDYLEHIRARPVWQTIPDEARARFRGALPVAPADLAAVHEEFMEFILPFAVGNAHPGFMGWVHGGGTPVGMVAEMLAAGLNANLGGRNQIPIDVERQITQWMCEVFGFPRSATGLFVTGTSMANFIAVVVARDVALGFDLRRHGLTSASRRLTAYASTATHGSVAKAVDLAGIGSEALRLIPTDRHHRIDLHALEQTILRDREAGCAPFIVVGTAGTVDTGAIDDLVGLADLTRREHLWFHVDGANGALVMLAPDLAPRLRGIEGADSLAFDFHKWGHVPYDAGFVLVRDGGLHYSAFATSAAYMRREQRGLAAGSAWPCDFGPDLSRGFRALKTWFTLKVYGTRALGASISATCALARYLERRIVETPELELLAPVELNIVCFRYRADEADRINAQIAVDLQEAGRVAPSTTIVDGHLAIRAAIVNHRTGRADIDALVDDTVARGRALRDAAGQSRATPRTQAEDTWARAVRESALQQVERELAANPDAIDDRLRRARLLTELGRDSEARDDYIALLQREPSHREALNDLGSLLFATRHSAAARIAYTEAVTRYPDDAMSRVNLGTLLFKTGELADARAQYEHALRVEPDNPQAHIGLSFVLADLGNESAAAEHRQAGFRNRFVIAMPYRGEGPAISVLQLVSTTGGNVRAQMFLDDRLFRTFLVVPEFFDSAMPLPAHQLVINAIGDAEAAAGALVAAQSLLALSSAPIINPPSVVMATGRGDTARRLSSVPGVVTATTATVPRELLSASDVRTTLTRHGFEFPLLLRTPGFHTGQHFLRIERLDDLPAALTELPGRDVIVMRYLDARGVDGKSRKYRVMMIDGQLYPLHVAISSHWKIHYFTAEMAASREHRAEDAAFLSDMPRVLGPRAMRALEGIQATLGLDYGGIDFGLNPQGDVLLFEANATMVVNPPEPEERWAYRQPAVDQIYSAVQRMLLRRALPIESTS